MDNFLKMLVTELNDEYTAIAADGKATGEYKEFVDTGSYALNALLSGSIYGGMADNKVLCFAGDPATGKTFFTLGIEKRFLDHYPESFAIKFDTESTSSSDMFASRGIDPNRVIVSEPNTIQQFRTRVLQFIEAYMSRKDRPKAILSLDSLGQLSTEKEVADSLEGKDTRDMTRAQLIRGTFRTIRLKLARAKVPMIITNHTYDAVGAYIPTKNVSGGGGMIYAADTICMLSKSKERDADKEVIGNIITVRLYKSRLTKENQSVEVLLTYDKGLDRYWGLLDICEKYGIFKKLSKQWEMPDGSKVFESKIKKNPEKFFTKEILEQIDIACKKEFLYGQGETSQFEKEEGESN